MKFLILCALVAVAAAEWSPMSAVEMKKMRMDCLDECKLPAEMKQKIANFEYPKDEKVMQFVQCVGKKMEIWDDMKGWEMDRLMMIMKNVSGDKKEMRELMMNCMDKNEQKSSAEEWSWRSWTCMMKTKPLYDAFTMIIGH